LLYESTGKIPNEFVNSTDSELIYRMMNLEVNSPKVSSMGRLFDGVASLIGIKDKVSYEGQAAILLESLAEKCDNYYRFRISEGDIIYYDWTVTIVDILSDLNKNVRKEKIAAKFMNTLSKVGTEIAVNIREKYSINKVVLSGGVFQNIYLLNKMYEELIKSNFEVYHHKKVSPNDEGLPLGQIAIAAKGGGKLCV